MQVIVTGRHLEITDAIREHAIQKGNRMPRYYDRVSEVEVVVAKAEPNHYQVEMIASVDNHDPFVVHVKHEDLYAGIDEASHKLERQLTDHKEKLRNRKHTAAHG
jgi:putative sigma-54 modulation protein